MKKNKKGLKMHGFIRNRVYILDISSIARDIENCLKTINENLLFMENIDFKTAHILIKCIMLNVICDYVKDTNDLPVSPLIVNNIYNDLIYNLDIKISLDIIKNNFHNIFKTNIFNFNNVEINIDLMVQGTTLYVYTYENDME